MSKGPCNIPQAPNGENSKLYLELQRLCGEGGHLLANYIYATYLANGVGAQMDVAVDANGNRLYKKNSQGEHNAKDVYKFLDVATLANEAKAKAKAGIDPATRTQIQYDNATDALNEANTFNQNHTGRVAYVVQQGDKFQVVTEDRDSRTQIKSAEVQEQQALWNTLTTEFQNAGIDLSTFDFIKDIANPLTINQFLQYLGSLQTTRNSLLSLRDIETLLTMGQNIPQVQNLMSRGWGTLADVAQKVYDSYHTPGTVTPAVATMINNVLNLSKNYQVDLTAIQNTLANESSNFRVNSEEVTIQQEIDALHNKYGINNTQLLRTSDKITKLSDAAVDAAFTLQRQLRNIERQQGKTTQGKAIEANLQQLMKEIEGKHYYSGLLTFLNQAIGYATQVENLLQNIPNAGTRMEYAAARAKALSRAQVMQDGYATIVESLINIDSLLVDESMSDADKQQLIQLAKDVKVHLENQARMMADLRESTMTDICVEVLGDVDYNGVAISNLLTMAEADSSIFDYLYSVGRASNPLIGAMGTIIRDAQDTRNKKQNEISLRIRRATDNLYKSGSNSEFIYSGDGHIISDIDWVAYNTARTKAIKGFYKAKLKGFDLKDAIESWEEANTEERVVDIVTGRTERVPNAAFQDDTIAVWDSVNNKLVFQNGILTPEQQEYYDTMMQIKGEIGTLMPSYVQKQYLPAQIRNSWVDIVARGIRGKMSAKAVAKNLLERMKIWKIRQDDTNYYQNGVILEGEEFNVINSDFDNTPLRQIPIFYVNKLEDQNDLLRDFSSSLQSLASTAINYEAMSNVKDTVEFMGDYIESQGISAHKHGIALADTILGEGIQVAKKVKEKSLADNTTALIEGFISAHIYGEKTLDTARWAVLMRNLVNYSSLKGLAVNVKGAISNFGVGELQNVIEAAGGENMNMKDLLWAHGVLFGNSRMLNPGRIMDYFTNNKNSLAMLLAEKFDPVMDDFSDASHKRYYKSTFRKIFGGFNPMTGYSYGEYLIHFVNMYAMLNHQKMFKNGKRISLYEAFSVGNKMDGNSELLLDPDVTIGEKVNGKWVDSGRVADEAFLIEMRQKIRGTNQKCHGSMNEEDKGLIHRRMVGKAVMNFRQWMVEHYSKRWRKRHWDASTHRWEEGYRRTANRFYKDMIKGMLGMQVESAAHWKELSDDAKANIRRFWMENSLLAGLQLLSFAMGDADKKNRDWWTRMWMYQVNRALLDFKASTSLGALLEAKTMINSPIASVNTFNGLLYPIVGLPEIGETIKSGRYKGWNKYARGLYKYTLPFGYQIDQCIHMDEDEGIFQIFDSSQYYK